jgi:hypothetical protein
MPQDRIDGRKVNGSAFDRFEFDAGQPRRSKLAQAAFGTALVALAIGAISSAARAGDTDPQEQSISDKIMQTLGLHNPGETQYEINYSERSPLVVPPSRNLPPPLTSSALPAPNWPKDPEVLRRQASKDDQKPVVRPYDSVMESSRPLRPDELGVGRVTPTVAAPGTNEQSRPSQLGEPKKNFFSFDWMKKEEYATFTGEPVRANLTDPPPGYQTPSPDQPYGISPDRKAYKPQTLGERMELPR